MERRKLTSEDIDKVRDIEGFPIATDEAIIELSDAPYYTACPNPFIKDFIYEYGTPYDEATDNYHCEPFTADVSEGKNDPIYTAYSYHTKVPPKAIVRYLLHYTQPGDLVLDGFCGSGMTGVAAQLCETLDANAKYELAGHMSNVQWGSRKAILNDLSPAATYIAYNYNMKVDYDGLKDRLENALNRCQQECGWMYQTQHVIDGKVQLGIDNKPIMGTIEFVVWSDVFVCPSCSEEFVFWSAAANEDGTVSSTFKCPHCGAELKKTSCEIVFIQQYDERLGEVVEVIKQVPVLIVYSLNGKRYAKKPDDNDFNLLKEIDSKTIPYWFPIDRMIDGSESRRNDRIGITHIYQFFTKRNLWTLACFWDSIRDDEYAPFMKQFVIGSLRILSKLAKHNVERRSKTNGYGWVNAGVSGTLYVASCPAEQSPLFFFSKKIRKLLNYSHTGEGICITTGSCTQLTVPDSCIDYIFTDPPFGANINYSELSFIWEAWLRCVTNNEYEAIMNQAQSKGLPEYQHLMTECFKEYYRVLKPGRWMTVEFHNSKNSVWNAIQQGLQRAGFVVADVRTLDKKVGSFKQVTTTSTVKQDLVISAYKPRDQFVREIIARAGDDQTAWAFVRQHLGNIPVIVERNGSIEPIAERQAYLLFDRMVAYHVTQGIPVPLDATDFYRGLDERFIKRDDMYFLPDQVTEYDTARLKMDVEQVQTTLLVTNEKTAIGWLYALLDKSPMIYQEIQPKFMQAVKTVDRYEDMPELAVLLEENFLQDDKGRWYVPDTKKEGDVAKLRKKSLLREFDGYLKTKGKLKLFRSEAIREGFSKLWKDKNYQGIVDIAERLPTQTVQEDPNLLMYYDISLSRVGQA